MSNAVTGNAHCLINFWEWDAVEVCRVFSSLEKSACDITLLSEPSSNGGCLKEKLTTLIRHHWSGCCSVFVVRILVAKQYGSGLWFCTAIVFQLPCQDPPHSHGLVFWQLQLRWQCFKCFRSYEVLDLDAFCTLKELAGLWVHAFFTNFYTASFHAGYKVSCHIGLQCCPTSVAGWHVYSDLYTGLIV